MRMNHSVHFIDSHHHTVAPLPPRLKPRSHPASAPAPLLAPPPDRSAPGPGRSATKYVCMRYNASVEIHLLLEEWLRVCRCEICELAEPGHVDSCFKHDEN